LAAEVQAFVSVLDAPFVEESVDLPPLGSVIGGTGSASSAWGSTPVSWALKRGRLLR
jgi:hypothetical protein